MKNKKKLSFIALSLVTAFSLIGSALGTMSWFVTTVDAPKYNINGKSAGAYFAYGDGSAEKPFGISIPRHLYNLSWLQYMGQFSDKQYYFELSDSIDDDEGLNMNNYILPPIGTEENPFVGNFNGNGKIIKNLTVTNDEDAIFGSNKHPDQTQVTYTAPEIVGFFGVVGNLGGAYEGTYVSNTNTIYNLGITDFTIQTTTSKALVGIAAGYVDATIANVAVNASTIDVQTASTAAVDSANLTSNLSDYGVVGYATANYKKNIKKIEQNLYDITIAANAEFNANDEGDSQGWGGSINMKTIYNRIISLTSLKKSIATDVASGTTNGQGGANWRVDRTYFDNTEKTEDRTTYSTVGTSYNNEDGYARLNGYKRNDHEYIGSYNVYMRRPYYTYGDTYNGNYTYNSDYSTYGDQQFLYLSGGHYETRTYYTNYSHEGFYITDGTNYLIYNGSLGNTTTSSDATLWTYESGSNKSITTTYNGTTYYLYNNNGVLGVRNSSYASWTISLNNDSTIYDIYNGNYHLTCLGGIWKLVRSFNSTFITDGTNFLRCVYNNYNSGTLSSTTDTNNATTWTFSTYNGTGTISCKIRNGNTDYTYYLRNNYGTLQASTTSTNWTISTSNGIITISNGNYYLYHNGSNFDLTTFTAYYLIYDDSGHYLTNSSSYYAGYTNNRNEATKLGYNTTQRGYYDLEEGTNYYFERYSSTYPARFAGTGNNRYLYRLVNESGSLTGSQYGSGYLRGFRRQSDTAQNYYLQYTGNSTTNAWASVTDIASATPMNVDYIGTFQSSILDPNFTFTANINKTDSTSKKGPDYHQTSDDTTKGTNETKMYYTNEDTTYLPLNVNADLESYDSNNTSMLTKINNGNFDPKDSNTGYLISGSSSLDSTSINAGISNIRISRYEISNVSASYNKSSGNTTTIADLADSNVHTYKIVDDTDPSDGITTSTMNNFSKDIYPRYSDSKTSFFQNSLATGSTNNNGVTTYTTNKYVYGLHFMSSTISASSIVNASKVSVLGNKCDNYQFPVNCIDFNLKQKGVINFFAGTYFSGNNSFFSLHQVLRNEDATGKTVVDDVTSYTSYKTINNIKEIEEVWSTDVGEKTTKYANIYKYSDGTYMVPYRVDGNQNQFVMTANDTTDTNTPYTYATMNSTTFNTYKSTYGYKLRFLNTQIGKQDSEYTTKRIYYFEIPMNPGEYCLGSVTGGTGAYLLYLDIGANAAKTQRTTIYEHYKEIKKVFEYPCGVAVVAVSTVAENMANSTTLDETNTSNFVIYANTKGTVKVTRANNEVTLSRTSGLITNAKPTQVGDAMWVDSYYNIHDPGGNNLTSEITPTSNTVTEVRRLQYYDYNVNLDELMITHIIDTKVDNGGWTRTFYQEYANGTSTTTFSDMRIYNTANGAKYLEEDLSNPSTSTVKTYSGADESSVVNTVIFCVTYVEDNGETLSYDWLLEMQVDENAVGRYYIFNDYVFSATAEGGSIILTVVTKGAKAIKINNTTINSVGQKVTISPANP